MNPAHGTEKSTPLVLSILDGGERSPQLAKWLGFLATDSPSVRVKLSQRSLDGLLDAPLDGILLVDADRLQAADSGLLSRRVQRDGVRLWLFGDDPARAVVARLFRETDARWLSWPPDFDSLRAVLESPDASKEGASLSELERRAEEIERAHPTEGEPQFELRPTRSRSESFGLEPGELEQIESILRGEEVQGDEGLEEDLEFDDLLTELDEDDVEEESLLEEPTPSPILPPAAASGGNPSWFKDQIADLADHVQRLELGLERAMEEGQPEKDSPLAGGPMGFGKLRDISDEAARLGQFTRTLGFLAAPPARGDQLFDLRTLLEEQLRTRAAEQDAPRFLIRIPEVLPIRSDKTLLLQAFDALLFMARSCTPAGDTMRIEASGQTVDGEPLIGISIRFPRGPLADLETATIQRPYGLKRVLPQLGPNAIAAAQGIFRGQGGEAHLAEDGPQGLEWQISLPRVEPAR